MTKFSSILDDMPIRRGQYGVMALIMLCLVLDGIDMQLLSFVTPLLLSEWSIDRTQFAPALAAATFGMTIGSAIGGALGDRWGRKSLVVGSTLFFGVMTIGASLSNDVLTLAILRFLCGLGFGAAVPNAYALANEWLPQRARARAVGILTTSGPVGGSVGSIAAIFLIPALGWRGCFVACGLVVICAGIWMLLKLPESVAFLLKRGETGRAGKLMRRVLRVDINDTFEEAASKDNEVRNLDESGDRLFTKDNLRLNFGSPTGYFFIAFVSYALVGWIPTMLTMSGLEIELALLGSLAFNGLGLIGVLGGPFMIERIGSRSSIILSCILCAVALTGLGGLLVSGIAATSTAASAFVLLLLGMAGIGIGASVTGTMSIATFGYPVQCRAGGLGLTVAGGRAGGIAGILAGGSLLSLLGNNLTPMFLALVFAIVAAAVVMTVIDRHIPAK